ncbi:MAG: Rne/Rng family ribonuclease [Phycisphaerae bacterium]
MSKTKKEMLINTVANQECRIAILEDGALEELYIERASKASHVGNIYKGKVTNVEPSIQAAFIDFGMGKNGFLHISDINPQYFPKGQQDIEPVGRKRPQRDRPPIQQCLRRGQEVIVQMIKEGIGTKGPTLTTYLSIPGRMLVMMPGMSKLGVSRKVDDEDTRDKARDVLKELKLPKDMGFIVRTAGLGRSKRDLQRDLNYLLRLWKSIKHKNKTTKAPAEIYQESDLITRTIRDIYNSDIDRIACDDVETAHKVKNFLDVAMPRTKHAIDLYVGDGGIFHDFGIEDEIEKIYSRRVEMKSGGSLVIDQTEALVAIDVNSGRFRKHNNAEETALQMNLQAAKEITRQLRLRDLGGLIVIDFIDMRHDKNRRAVEREVRKLVKNDRAKTKILRLSAFGLLEMTRQRLGPSLKHSIYGTCECCQGSGLVKSPESQALLAMRVLQRALSDKDVAEVEMTVTPSVALYMGNHQRHALAAMEERTGKKILIHGGQDLSGDDLEVTCRNSRGATVAWEHDLTSNGKTNAAEVQTMDQWLKQARKQSQEKPEEREQDQEQDTGEKKDQPRDEDQDQDQEGKKKKRRRRGRRGGKKHRKKEQQEQAEQEKDQQAQAEQQPQQQQDQKKDQQEQQDQDQSDQKQQESDQPAAEKKKRSRRGRRGGRGRRKDDQSRQEQPEQKQQEQKPSEQKPSEQKQPGKSQPQSPEQKPEPKQETSRELEPFRVEDVPKIEVPAPFRDLIEQKDQPQKASEESGSSGGSESPYDSSDEEQEKPESEKSVWRPSGSRRRPYKKIKPSEKSIGSPKNLKLNPAARRAEADRPEEFERTKKQDSTAESEPKPAEAKDNDRQSPKAEDKPAEQKSDKPKRKRRRRPRKSARESEPAAEKDAGKDDQEKDQAPSEPEQQETAESDQKPAEQQSTGTEEAKDQTPKPKAKRKRKKAAGRKSTKKSAKADAEANADEDTSKSADKAEKKAKKSTRKKAAGNKAKSAKKSTKKAKKSTRKTAKKAAKKSSKKSTRTKSSKKSAAAAEPDESSDES